MVVPAGICSVMPCINVGVLNGVDEEVVFCLRSLWHGFDSLLPKADCIVLKGYNQDAACSFQMFKRRER